MTFINQASPLRNSQRTTRERQGQVGPKRNCEDVRVFVDESGGVINFIVNDDEEILHNTDRISLLAYLLLPPALLVSPPVKEIINPGRMAKAAAQ